MGLTFGYEEPYRLAKQIKECVCQALADLAPDGAVGNCCVVPGQVEWNCEPACEGGIGGQLAVEIVDIYETSSFPAQQQIVQGTAGCPPPSSTIAMDLRVTVLRCMPGGEHDGKCPPSCECLEQVSNSIYADMSIVRNAIGCCIPKTNKKNARGRRFVMGRTEVVGPNGGCVGSTQMVTVALRRCGDCKDFEWEPGKPVPAAELSEIARAIVAAGGKAT